MSAFPTGETRLYPILGDPIRYARSPEVLTRSLRAAGHNAICLPLHVAPEAFAEAMRGLVQMRNVDGMILTMPHKQAGLAHCATLSDRARLLGAVNVMRRGAEGWHGDMVDGLAFVKAQVDAGARPQGARALVVGAGGAGSAIALALAEVGVRELVIHDRDRGRAEWLADLVSRSSPARATAGPADPAGCDLVCNASSLGMAEGDPLPVDPARLAAPMFVGDVIAGHGLTPFLRAARDAGCGIAGGDQMIDAMQEMMLEFFQPPK